jgi:hypothetical protein
MKKLFVLFLCLMGVAGLMAAPIHPPGVDAPGMTLSVCGVETVSSGTVLAMAARTADYLGSVMAVAPIIDISAARPSDTLQVFITDISPMKTEAVVQPVDFPLLC